VKAWSEPIGPMIFITPRLKEVFHVTHYVYYACDCSYDGRYSPHGSSEDEGLVMHFAPLPNKQISYPSETVPSLQHSYSICICPWDPRVTPNANLNSPTSQIIPSFSKSKKSFMDC
jgi:hypothetical protein